MAHFFIDRPIFAWVLAIVIMLAGVLAINTLSLEQYPDIAPPKVNIRATYNGASAQTLEDSVTQVIEQQMKGLDNLEYMSATSSSAGASTISLSFKAGTDPDVAQMQVQNKLQQASSRLPQAVQNTGVTVTRSSTDILMIVSLVSDDPTVRGMDIGDYIRSTLEDQISRVEGVGDVTTYGTSYAMRIWLDPAKLQKYALMPSDVTSALRAQNTEVSAGQLGNLPAVPGQELNATITARSKLSTVEQFRQVIVKSASDGAVVTLADVARVELGGESYNITSQQNGKPSAAIAIQLASGANAVATSEAVLSKIKELEPYFPAALKLKSAISYDTTPFIKVSIREVIKTLLEAIVLVVLIMYLFLQSIRATFIPAVTVPVVLLGTFGILSLFGYSINTLTMFGLVLAIGLLVDDAIVVVENVERLMQEEHLSPREATRKSMTEITGALVGIAIVLSGVFIPMAFFSGSTGVIYRQFSITIISAMGLSVLVALTLTPALCATLLKPHTPTTDQERQRGFFGWFNRFFERNARRYQSGVAGFLSRGRRSLLLYILIVGVMAVCFLRLPTSFLPNEDQGVLMAQIKLPVGATDQQTAAVMRTVQQYFLKQPEVIESLLTINGAGSGGNSQNSARAFIKLQDWDKRTATSRSAAAIAERANIDLKKIREANIFVVSPAAVRGLGQSSGFNFVLKDVGGVGHDALIAARNQFISMAQTSNQITGVRTNGLDDTPQFRIDIDDSKANALNLNVDDINSTLSTAMGGTYVNDFLNNGRVKRVYVQGDAPFRMQPADLSHWYVRNAMGQMVPFSSFASSRWTHGPSLLERYNGVSSFEIIGQPAEGVSSGAAMQEVDNIMKKMPAGISIEWTGASYQERMSGAQAPLLYALSILFVFLCLAALYESWTVPFAVIMVVPLGVAGTVWFTGFLGLSNDVYFQVGLLTTVGLSAKNAILIVEFAKQLHEAGKSLLEATLEAVYLRLRPILMTSLAFMFGVLPLAIASGAGSASRRAIGTGVLGGMIAATIFGIFFVPLFYFLISKAAHQYAGWNQKRRTNQHETESIMQQEGI
ncbi:efflux RND transporter permease subunit [Glaciimonas immobilis]|uniref:Efflux pump membrane transporter n=1 Tax=Glaciimonas immobilis TaxID=728004 RepID=A0A840RVR7_9BURK|nr:efflux RND transporter permease subunit [Glaciimonas immobilis]KAF3996398.1 efflux RND transporter permease subunit [Glaciimonas immobilis]MBB5201272.1 HAE1 family hydrophobic/amphiphilic exporter-1/multidrug efflux pump [Glaciimonas immobilis]